MPRRAKRQSTVTNAKVEMDIMQISEASLAAAARGPGCARARRLRRRRGRRRGDPASGGDKVTIGIKFDQPGLGPEGRQQLHRLRRRGGQYVAKELGYTETVDVQGDAVGPAGDPLQSDQVDMIFATYSITDDRKPKVSFAGPYFVAGQDLLVKSDNTDITGPETLNGKKLCSVTGSTQRKKIKDKFANGVQLQEYGAYSECVEALNAGAIDAVTTDDVILAGFAAQPRTRASSRSSASRSPTSATASA